MRGCGACDSDRSSDVRVEGVCVREMRTACHLHKPHDSTVACVMCMGGWVVAPCRAFTLTHTHPPTHPSCRRLLPLSLQLSDVLRRFEPGIKQHIHLVVAGLGETRAPPSQAAATTPAASATAASSPLVSSPVNLPSAATEGLRHRHPLTAAAGGSGAHTWQNSPAPGAMGGAADAATSAQLNQLAVAAHQYAQAAQQCAAMGYPHEVVGAYVQQAQQFSHWYYQLAASAGVATPASPHSAAAAAPAAVSAEASNSPAPVVAPVAEPAAPAAAHEDANRFARAGHEADAGFADRDEIVPPAQLTLRARILESIALMFKLAFFLAYFGSHVGGWRYAALVLLCVVTLLYQGGWVQRGNGAQQQQEPRDAADRPAAGQDDRAGEGAAVDEGNEEDEDEDEEDRARRGSDGEEDSSNADSNEHDNDNDDDEDQGRLAQDADGPNDQITPVSAASADAVAAAVVAPRPPRPLMRVVSTIVVKFFVSMVPGMLERQAE
jgi:hypothetical protein